MYGFLLLCIHLFIFGVYCARMLLPYGILSVLCCAPNGTASLLTFQSFFSIDSNLGKLHICSLTAQCITLFYALLLEVQDLSSGNFDCSDGTCKRKISDLVMDYLLVRRLIIIPYVFL